MTTTKEQLEQAAEKLCNAIKDAHPTNVSPSGLVVLTDGLVRIVEVQVQNGWDIE